MSTFDTGKLGEEYVRRCLIAHYVDVRKVPDDITIQLEWGDLAIPSVPCIGIERRKIEVKTELNNPNDNFFMERWSNKSTGRPGWLITSPADELFYLFWSCGYGFRFPNWQQSAWIIDYNRYELIRQNKHSQNNDTWGYLVKFDALNGPVAPIRFDMDKNIMAAVEKT